MTSRLPGSLCEQATWARGITQLDRDSICTRPQVVHELASHRKKSWQPHKRVPWIHYAQPSPQAMTTPMSSPKVAVLLIGHHKLPRKVLLTSKCASNCASKCRKLELEGWKQREVFARKRQVHAASFPHISKMQHMLYLSVPPLVPCSWWQRRCLPVL